MIIAGINSGFDAKGKEIFSGGSALMVDGNIIGAVAEERITRKKHVGGYSHSLEALLRYSGLRKKDVGRFYISFYGNPPFQAKKLLDWHLKDLGLSKESEKFVVLPSHHLSHAVLAFFLSPFEEALVMVADNEGNALSFVPEKSELINTWCERNTYYWAKGNCIEMIDRDFAGPRELGFGKAYNKFTWYIGFGNYHHAGKTMGLSAYGHLEGKWKDIDIWEYNTTTGLKARMKDTNNYRIDIPEFFERAGVPIPPPGGKDSYKYPEYQRMAAFVQQQLNRWSEIRCRELVNRFKVKNLCISGGVGLNSIMNHHLEKSLGLKVFVPPYPCDEGQALGNAIIGTLKESGINRNHLIRAKRFDNTFFLGPVYPKSDYTAAINNHLEAIVAEHLNDRELFSRVAEMISKGKIVGWFQGRSEYGARALGNRSILADPCRAEMQDRMNVVKGRELFRPVAPSVLKHEAHNWFTDTESLLLPGMLGVVDTTSLARKKIPAAIHVDNASRVQVVRKEDNLRYFKLLQAYQKLTNVPVLLNTSFNAAGDPIVETPSDAIDTFKKMNLDALVMGNTLIIRSQRNKT